MDAKLKKLLTYGAIALGAVLLYKNLKGGTKTSQGNQGGPNNQGNQGGPNNQGGQQGGGGQQQLDPQNELRIKGIANDLFDAMNQCGTEDVNNILSGIRSELEFQACIKAYGTRTVTSPWWCLGISDFTGGLLESLNSELSNGEIDDANKVLAQNGVTTKIPK